MTSIELQSLVSCTGMTQFKILRSNFVKALLSNSALFLMDFICSPKLGFFERTSQVWKRIDCTAQDLASTERVWAQPNVAGGGDVMVNRYVVFELTPKPTPQISSHFLNLLLSLQNLEFKF